MIDGLFGTLGAAGGLGGAQQASEQSLAALYAWNAAQVDYRACLWLAAQPCPGIHWTRTAGNRWRVEIVR